MRNGDRRQRLCLVFWAIVVFGAGVSPMSSLAHSMADVEAELEAGEPAAEVVDEPMPEVVLDDGTGSPVRLTESHRTVVVLSFDDRRVRGSCAAIDRTIAKARALVAEVEGLSEQLRIVTVIAGKRDVTERSDQKCEEGGSALAPQSVLYIRRGGENADSRLAETLGFRPGVTSGVLVVGSSGRIRARFHGPEFAPVRLMIYAAALAHGEHGDPMDTDVAEVTAESDRISLRLALGGVFALSGALAYGSYVRWRRRTPTRHSERDSE